MMEGLLLPSETWEDKLCRVTVSVSLVYNIKQSDRHLMNNQNLQKKFWLPEERVILVIQHGHTKMMMIHEEKVGFI